MLFCPRNALLGSQTAKKVVRHLFYIFIVAGSIFLLTSQIAQAQTILDENFDYYSAGDLTGQGDWQQQEGYSHSIQVHATQWWSPPSSGTFFDDYPRGNFKIGNVIPAGEISFKFFFTAPAGYKSGWHTFLVGSTENTGALIAQLSFYCKDFDCVGHGGKVLLNDITPVCEFSINYWQSASIEWDGTTHKTRAKCGTSDWTEWVDQYYCFECEFTYANKILLLNGTWGQDIELRVDNIGEAYEGLYPPPQFELEDCSGYDLLERLICEIKNFFVGVFLPSASSTFALQNNLDLVKQRAPFNYILATKDFLIEANTNLSTSTPVISILNATGTLDFSLLNSTTTFAGTNQSIGAILRGFFKFILILGFLFWAIGFLRKIFK